MRKNSSENVIRLVESHQPGALFGMDNQPPARAANHAHVGIDPAWHGPAS